MCPFFLVLNIIQHSSEICSSLNIFARKTFVGIFAGYDHILVGGIFTKFVSLGIQTVTLYLYGGRHAGIQITFCSFLFHN